MLQEIESNVAQHREIFRPLADGDPAVVLTEDQVKSPMHDVLNFPNLSCRVPAARSAPCQYSSALASGPSD